MGDIIDFNNYSKKNEIKTVKVNTDNYNCLNDKLEEGILTFDRIYNYYLNHEDFWYMYTMATTSDLTNEKKIEIATSHIKKREAISRIPSLKRYSQKAQLNYLVVARDIVIKKRVVEELQNISDLTRFFIDNKENIDDIEISELESIINKDKGKGL